MFRELDAECSLVLHVADIIPPYDEENQFVEFMTQTWLDDAVDTIIKMHARKDTSTSRVPPMALTRCSRGGKTRALQEIARLLKRKLPNAAVILISFNDNSSIQVEEQSDPMGALCRRIAFAGRRNYFEKFHNFREMKVEKHQILQWLGDSSCVLLIDELNNLEIINDQISVFLKDNFLSTEGRYLVFSSHVISTQSVLVDFMDNNSNRNVLPCSLPLILNLEDTRQIVIWTGLNAIDALFYGLIPALIWLANCSNHDVVSLLPFEKIKMAVRKCITGHMVTDDSVREMFRTFITGDDVNFLAPLLPFMDSSVKDKRATLCWIPFHMHCMFEMFGNSILVNCSQRKHFKVITKLLVGFRTSKYRSGDSWECLFVVVLLIRVLTLEFDTVLLPLNTTKFEACGVSYNELFDESSMQMDECKRLDAFIDRLITPTEFPHIDIYHMGHAQFKDVDVILAGYNKHEQRSLYVYQLKEGNEIPLELNCTTALNCRFVVRGKAAVQNKSLREWTVPSTDEIEVFFGASGKQWIPSRWASLSQGKFVEAKAKLSKNESRKKIESTSDKLFAPDNFRLSAGAVGLKNVGNTCYMNSMIQCLSSSAVITNFLRGSKKVLVFVLVVLVEFV